MISSVIGSMINGLAEARWLTRARVSAYGRILLGMTLAVATAWIFTSKGGLDPLGKPLGTDFLSFWAASKLTLIGHAAQVYDVAAHQNVERAAFPGSHLGYEAFFYPPTYLLACLPLGLAPYGVSLGAWLVAGGYACWRALRALIAPAGAGLVTIMLSYPGVFTNVGHGQNAFLTTALFAAGAVLMDRRPLLAGALLGLLAIKPHLGLVLPLGLIAAWRLRTVLGAVLSVAGLGGVSTLVFGPAIWLEFLKVSPLAGQALIRAWVPMADMQSVFAAVRLLHGGVALAWTAQSLAAIVVCSSLVWAVRRRSLGGPALVSLIVCATLLATPFLLDYDLMLAAIPLAWVAREALARTGFLRWEKIVLMSAFVLPLVSRTVATGFHIPMGPLVLSALFAVIVRRANLPEAGAESLVRPTATGVSRLPALSSAGLPPKRESVRPLWSWSLRKVGLSFYGNHF